MANVIKVAFPQNRLDPEIVYSPLWAVGEELIVDIIRVAPRGSIPCDQGSCLKLLRGETTEIPTPIAPCKACRSCEVPSYLKYMKAGSEGAVLLRRRYRKDVAAADLELAQPLELSIAGDKCEFAGGCPDLKASIEIVVSEGALHVCNVSLVAGVVTTPPVTHATGGIFGEVGLVLHGKMAINWEFVDEEGKANPRKLVVPNGFEYGPFYRVHACGSLKRLDSGHLDYFPHGWEFTAPSEGSMTVVAICHFEIPDASLEGPHRHCYT